MINNSLANKSSSVENKKESESEEEDYEMFEMMDERSAHRRVKVFDRFTIILQIFALRARNKVAKLQVIQFKINE